MDLNLKDKVVIVAGGASNIGREISLTFAKEDAKIVISDIDKKQNGKLAEKLDDLGANFLVYETDVTQNDQVVKMVKTVISKFGKVDILVNSVGWNYDEYFMDEKREKWEKVIALNFWSMIYCTRAVLDNMVERKCGSIVSIGSDAGRMGEFREGIYSGCKAAVIGLTKTLARELGKSGIRLNVVCPGLTIPANEEVIGEHSHWVEEMEFFTPEARQKALKLYPLRRLAKAEDIANVVVFLASDRAGYLTGQTISVSGGYTMV